GGARRPPGGRPRARARPRSLLLNAPGDLEDGRHARGFRRPDAARVREELRLAAAKESAEAAVQELARRLEHGPPRASRAEDECEELLVGERRSAAHQQLLAGAIRLGRLGKPADAGASRHRAAGSRSRRAGSRRRTSSGTEKSAASRGENGRRARSFTLRTARTVVFIGRSIALCGEPVPIASALISR